MSNLDTFTLVTGLASLFAFVIQIFDLFPKFSKGRDFLVVFLPGVFIGSLMRAFDASSVKLKVELNGMVVVVTVAICLVVGFLVWGARTTDPGRRSELFAVGGIAAIPTLFILLAWGISNAPAAEFGSLSVHELSVLADEASRLKDYERAVSRLQDLKGRLLDESQRKAVDDRIRKAQAEALSGS
jgi:hypothetical protein